MSNNILLKANDSSSSFIISETSMSSSFHISNSLDFSSVNNRFTPSRRKKKNMLINKAKKADQALKNNNKSNNPLSADSWLSSQDYSSNSNLDEYKNDYSDDNSIGTTRSVCFSESEISNKAHQRQKSIYNKKNLRSNLSLPYVNSTTESLPLQYPEKQSNKVTEYWNSINTTDSCPKFNNRMDEDTQKPNEVNKFTHVVEKPSSCCLLI